MLPLFQSVADLRDFLLVPLGWSTLNGMLISSLGINMIRKQAAIEAGGYRTDVTDATVELVMRLHRLMRQQQRPYQICFVADPVCWRQIPADHATLKPRHLFSTDLETLPFCTHLDKSLLRNRTAEKISLHLVATIFTQII